MLREPGGFRRRSSPPTSSATSSPTPAACCSARGGSASAPASTPAPPPSTRPTTAPPTTSRGPTRANPGAQILSAAAMLRESFGRGRAADGDRARADGGRGRGPRDPRPGRRRRADRRDPRAREAGRRAGPRGRPAGARRQPGMSRALLLVDLQNDYLEAPGLDPPPGELVRRAAILLEACRADGTPVMHSRTTVSPSGDDRMPHWRAAGRTLCVEGTPGHEPPPALAPRAGEPCFDKTFFSAFSSPGMGDALDRAGVRELIVCGVHLHGCVRATALDAYARGLRVLIALRRDGELRRAALGGQPPLARRPRDRVRERRLPHRPRGRRRGRARDGRSGRGRCGPGAGGVGRGARRGAGGGARAGRRAGRTSLRASSRARSSARSASRSTTPAPRSPGGRRCCARRPPSRSRRSSAARRPGHGGSRSGWSRRSPPGTTRWRSRSASSPRR